jgi:hypothetical protein
VSETAFDEPEVTRIFDAETHKLVGLNYRPGLADDYQPDLCTGRLYFEQSVGAGELPEGCVPSQETQLCPVGDR